MQAQINAISLSLPFRMGQVNCYLVQAGKGYVLVDTASSNQQSELETRLEQAGCRPGSLKLIVITHGDFDHTGNAAYLRQKFSAPIGMHPNDAGMAERGDMFWNRKSGNALIRWAAPLLFRFGSVYRFSPDVALEDGQSLSEYGLNASILLLPGHSSGSIGVLTAEGDLLCGDLLENSKHPALNSIMDDPPAAKASIEKLRSLAIGMVYPGHGRPFVFEHFLKINN